MDDSSILVLSLVACLAVMVSAQGTGNSDPVFNNATGEVDFNDDGAKDREYYNKLEFNKEDLPLRDPVEKEVLREYANQVKRGTIGVLTEEQVKGDSTVLPSLREATAEAKVVNFNYSYSVAPWPTKLPCCPKKQDYTCGTQIYPLPCFQIQLLGTWGVCCPLWPSIKIVACNCCRCWRMCDDCIYSGFCTLNYTFKWFLAVCNHVIPWRTIFLLQRYVPTSCKCNAPLCSLPYIDSSSSTTSIH